MSKANRGRADGEETHGPSDCEEGICTSQVDSLDNSNGTLIAGLKETIRKARTTFGNRFEAEETGCLRQDIFSILACFYNITRKCFIEPR